jgi:hypothetical protein
MLTYCEWQCGKRFFSWSKNVVVGSRSRYAVGYNTTRTQFNPKQNLGEGENIDQRFGGLSVAGDLVDIGTTGVGRLYNKALLHTLAF